MVEKKEEKEPKKVEEPENLDDPQAESTEPSPEMTAEEIAVIQEKKDKGEKLTPEEEEVLKGSTEEKPPEETPPAPEGEETPAPTETPPPTETPEQMVARLQAENEQLKVESQGRLRDVVEARERVRLAEIERRESGRGQAQPAGAKSVLEGREESDYINIADARAIQQENLNNVLAEVDTLRLTFSELIAQIQHPDYKEVVQAFYRMAQLNPSLNKLAYFDSHPAEYMYQKAMEDPEIKAKHDKEMKKEVGRKIVDTLQKPKPKLPKGGGGGGPAGGKINPERAADLSASEWAKLPSAERARLLKETGK